MQQSTLGCLSNETCCPDFQKEEVFLKEENKNAPSDYPEDISILLILYF